MRYYRIHTSCLSSFKLGAYVSSLYSNMAVQLLIYAPNFRKTVGANTKEGGLLMEIYIGIGFIILCLAVLAGIVGILGYHFYADKEKVDISPAKANINISNKNDFGE